MTEVSTCSLKHSVYSWGRMSYQKEEISRGVCWHPATPSPALLQFAANLWMNLSYPGVVRTKAKFDTPPRHCSPG